MFKVFGQPNCADCKEVVRLLEGQHTYVDITTPKGYQEFRYYYQNSRTVPKVIVEDGHSVVDGGGGYYLIGGLKELRDWLKRHTQKS